MKLRFNYISPHPPAQYKAKQAGFTIIELMIATAILSTILLLATVMMINIGSLYYKGVNQSRTQDDARSITDQVSQDLKYNALLDNVVPTNQGGSTLGGNPVTIYAYCIGNVRYSYILGHKLGAGSDITGNPNAQHVLWRDNNSDIADDVSSTTGNCRPIDIAKLPAGNDQTGIELMAPNSRLTDFTIASSTSSYDISLGLAYGDGDLLCDSSLLSTPTTVSSCDPSATQVPGQFPATASTTILCKGQTGDQFCSVVNLKTTVVQRI